MDTAIRDLAEIERSREEAKGVKITSVNLSPYLNPRADAAISLEYAFYLLGDIRGKRVLDLGCGSGEEVIPLAQRGASVTALDISPELIKIAKDRAVLYGVEASFRVASAYKTGIASESIDVILCSSLIHHLDIPMAMDEMRRILKPDGYIVMKEPIRFSRVYGALRSLFPARKDASEYEHPLTAEEFNQVIDGFKISGLRFFRLPLSHKFRVTRWLSNAALRLVPFADHFATSVVLKLGK